MGSLQHEPLGFWDTLLHLPLTKVESSTGTRAVEQSQEELRRAHQGLSGSGSDNSEAQVCTAEPARSEGAGNTVAVDRSLKLKTKNKVAQKRYRQRNKEKFDSLQREVQALTSSLQDLEMAKQKLETETSMLRAQQQKAGTSGSMQPALSLGLKKAEEDFVPARSWAGFNPAGKGGVVLRALFNPPRKLTHEQCLRMSIMDYCRLYREVVFRCGQLLLENPQEDLTSPAGRKLKELISERRGMAAYISCAAPLSHYFIHSVNNLEDPTTVLPRADPAFYRTVMRKVGLSDSQKRALSSVYKQYLGKMQGLLREREELQASIKEGTVLTMENTNGGSPCLTISPVYKRMVRLLRENIDAEQIANAVFWGTIFLIPQGLTYFQEAKYMLASWPRFPDPFTLFNLVAHEMGDSCPADAPPAVKLEEAFLYSPFFYKPVHEKVMTSFLDQNIVNFQDGAEITQAFAEALGVA